MSTLMDRRLFLKGAAAAAGAAALGTILPASQVSAQDSGPFTLPDLPYPYDALEPHIDARTMEIHYSKHHAAYVSNLNAAVKGTPMERMSIEQIMRRGAENLPAAVRNNGGGHINHAFFWEIMSPDGGGEPGGALRKVLEATYGSFAQFREKFEREAKGRFGSGWAWLAVKRGKLECYSTPNQDNPWMQGIIPILGLDVWEHAYYLKYQNRRADYISAWWNVVDWRKVEERYYRALHGQG
ncbi:MAG: superoxide dismutase [Armatimonadota bacterium]